MDIITPLVGYLFFVGALVFEFVAPHPSIKFKPPQNTFVSSPEGHLESL